MVVLSRTHLVNFGKYQNANNSITYDDLLRLHLPYVEQEFGKYELQELSANNNVLAMGVVQTWEFVPSRSRQQQQQQQHDDPAAHKFSTWLQSSEGKDAYLQAKDQNKVKTRLDDYDPTVDDAATLLCCAIQ